MACTALLAWSCCSFGERLTSAAGVCVIQPPAVYSSWHQLSPRWTMSQHISFANWMMSSDQCSVMMSPPPQSFCFQVFYNYILYAPVASYSAHCPVTLACSTMHSFYNHGPEGKINVNSGSDLNSFLLKISQSLARIIFSLHFFSPICEKSCTVWMWLLPEWNQALVEGYFPPFPISLVLSCRWFGPPPPPRWYSVVWDHVSVEEAWTVYEIKGWRGLYV